MKTMKDLTKLMVLFVCALFMSINLTSCGDDDNYSNSLTVNGKEFSVTKVIRVTVHDTGSQGNDVSTDIFIFANKNYPDGFAQIVVPTEYLGKKLDLTKPWYNEETMAVLYFNREDSSDPYVFYAGDNIEDINNFKSGALSVTAKNGKVDIKAKGVGLYPPTTSKVALKYIMPDMSDWDQIPFEISYSGSYIEVEDE